MLTSGLSDTHAATVPVAFHAPVLADPNANNTGPEAVVGELKIVGGVSVNIANYGYQVMTSATLVNFGYICVFVSKMLGIIFIYPCFYIPPLNKILISETQQGIWFERSDITYFAHFIYLIYFILFTNSSFIT